MKVPSPADASGMDSQPLAFFLHSGAYSSFVLSTESRGDDSLLDPMIAGDLWGSDCVQLAESTVYFCIGTEAVYQAIAVYLDASGRTDPPQHSVSATFLSRGEQAYLGCISDMTYGAHHDQFFLPEGEYEGRLLGWNLERARDNFDADPKLFFENIYHELHFIGPAGYPVFLRPVGDDEMNEYASPD